jgi:hypothetical protein
MPDIPRKKVGIVSCSGEEIPEGTISRVATRLVLEKLRPEDTVTICLPLFLAGGREERTFARFYPTIAVDGCLKLCAKHGTERYSGQVTDVIVVSELLNGQEIKPGWRRSLDGRGMRLAEQVAEVIASRVDSILKATYKEVKPDLIPVTIQDKAPLSRPAPEQTCACTAQGLPVMRIDVGGVTVGLAGLGAILEQAYALGKKPDQVTKNQLLETVKVYNYIPAGTEAEYAEALLREYAALCRRKER